MLSRLKKIQRKAKKYNHELCVNLYHVNENIASTEGMRSWIKKSRRFRENAKDVKQHDIRNFGVMR